jgi:hypothetical protein
MSGSATSMLTDEHHEWVAQVCGMDPRTRKQPGAAGASASDIDPPASALGDAGDALVTDPEFERLVGAMEDEADDAIDTWNTQSTDSIFTYLKPEVQAQYQANGMGLQNSQQDFRAALGANPVDAKQLLAAFDAYSLRLGALVDSNAQLDALSAIGIAAALKPLFVYLMGVTKIMRKHRLEALLQRLNADLAQAESEVKDVKWKRRLNAVITVITLVAAPESALARIALAGGAITAHVVIDGALGSGSVKGKLVFVHGDGAEIAENMGESMKEAVEALGEGGKKFLGAAAGVMTFKLDTDELDEAKEAVERVKDDIKDVQKAYDDLMAGILPLIPEFISLDSTINRLNQTINQSLAVSSIDTAAQYKSLRDLISKAAATPPS